jgi:hypothetical protein
MLDNYKLWSDTCKIQWKSLKPIPLKTTEDNHLTFVHCCLLVTLFPKNDVNIHLNQYFIQPNSKISVNIALKICDNYCRSWKKCIITLLIFIRRMFSSIIDTLYIFGIRTLLSSGDLVSKERCQHTPGYFDLFYDFYLMNG